jgi:hypothetical protein
MFLNGPLFWFLMTLLFVLSAAGFKAFAEDRGWKLNWWKSLLALIVYAVFALSLYAWGTLAGENEAGAGIKFGLLGLFITLILGVGLWRLIATKPKGV